METWMPGASPPSGGGAPLAQLSACHGRIDARCARLAALVERLVRRTAGHGDEPRAVAADLIRFFDHVIPRHHADEEEDLFPALIESMAGSDAVCLREITEGLRREHRLLEADWRELRGELLQVAGEVRAGVTVKIAHEPASTALARSARRFADRLHAHSTREDRELIPMAERLLSDEELAAIAASMQRRRGRLAQYPCPVSGAAS